MFPVDLGRNCFHQRQHVPLFSVESMVDLNVAYCPVMMGEILAIMEDFLHIQK